MSSADLVIINGRVAMSSSVRNVAVAAKGGKISWIGSSSCAPRAEKTVDAAGLLVLPGVIDVHVHLRDPGATYKEDFASGTAAAAAGGVTTVFDMPNNPIPTKDVSALREKERVAASKAIVDYGLYGLLTEGNSAEIEPMIGEGAIGFKCYMAETTGRYAPPPERELVRDMKAIGRARRRLSVHAEDDATIRKRVSDLMARGRDDPLAHYESRPEEAEQKAVVRAIALARESKCDTHIAHLSSAAGAKAVRQAKRSLKGRLTAETCPQYLLLDKGDYADKGSIMKVNPAIKTRKDREALWAAVRDGTVDMIATDHAPHSIDEKTSGPSVFARASGFPGLETSVALMLTCVNRRLISLARYVRMTSEAPAKAWGIFPKKGAIHVGADADFTVVDLKRDWRIRAAEFRSKAKYSPFDGFKAKGAAVYTVVRGHVVMDHGEVDLAHRGEMQRPVS